MKTSAFQFKYPSSLQASIIIPNFNGLRYLSNCLSSLRSLSFPKNNYEIIMVDNGSSDSSVDLIKISFPEIKIVQSSHNQGFGWAINSGIRISRGEYIVLLNNDTIVDKNWLKELVNTAESDKKIGIVGSKLLFQDEKDVINNAGSYISFPTGDGGDIGYRQIDRGQYEFQRRVPAVCGASMLIKRNLIKKIGALDEDFFLYYEDTDFCWRARLHGSEIIFNPHSIVYHVHSGTSKEWSPLFTFYVFRNKILMCLKNAPFSFLFVAVVSYGRQIIKEFNTDRRSIHFKILYSLLKNFLLFYKKRHYVRTSLKKIKEQEVLLLFTRCKYRKVKEIKTIGIYNAYFPILGGGELLMGAMARALLELFPGSFLEIICHPHSAFPDPNIFNHQLLEKWFSMCNFPYNLRKRVSLRVIKLPSISPYHVQKIASKIWLSLASVKYDIFVNNTYRSNIIALGRLNIYNCMFPQRLNGMSYTPFTHLRAFFNYKFLTSYNIFLAISLFTRNHMESYWKISPFILYPPIFSDNSSHFNSQKKENIILTIGRFFGGMGHVKKHDVIIDAFKRVCDLQQKHNWALVLVGRRQHDTATQHYIKSLEEKARGYNVRFVFDAHTKILNEFLSKAKIYIHATGYGEDPIKNPDRFEHLGLAVIEAMSFGVIPIVFHGGGLSETVKHSFNGFLFKTRKELVTYLKYLIVSPDKDIEKMRMNAKETAKHFTFANFKEKII